MHVSLEQHSSIHTLRLCSDFKHSGPQRGPGVAGPGHLAPAPWGPRPPPQSQGLGLGASPWAPAHTPSGLPARGQSAPALRASHSCLRAVWRVAARQGRGSVRVAVCLCVRAHWPRGLPVLAVGARPRFPSRWGAHSSTDSTQIPWPRRGSSPAREGIDNGDEGNLSRVRWP